MADNRGSNDMANQSNCSESYGEYLKRAAGACEAGDLVLGMHLYLAAYERAVVDPDIPDGMAIAGLREAWNLACDLKERSMAEYVFEKLEPFLTGDEIAQCASKLQSLALDRLEQYGFSREELEDMAEMISQDLMDGDGSIVKVESIAIPNMAAGVMAAALGDAAEDDAGSGELQEADEPSMSDALAAGMVDDERADDPMPKKRGKPEKVGLSSASADFNPYDMYNTSSVGTSYHAATNEGTGSYIFTRDEERATELERAQAEGARKREAGSLPDAHRGAAAQHDTPSQDVVQPAAPVQRGEGEPQDGAMSLGVGSHAGNGADAPEQAAAAMAKTAGKETLSSDASLKPAGEDMPSMPQVPAPGAPAFNYQSLAGYGAAVSAVRELGVGLERDAGFRNFIDMMNARHGLDRMPAVDTLLFRAPVIEDAARFVDATIGEIGLPVLRMSMEEGFQGAPVLCVTTFGDSRPRMNHAHNRFAGPAILVIDDLDTWSMPQIPENAEGIAGFVMANVSRGAREAINMIRSAVEDPDVYVLATASEEGDVDPFFYEILEPISIIDIAYPDEQERDEIWREIMHDHPSMRMLDRSALVRFSAHMPRYDIYMAARAAIEEAYKTGLVQRMYLPVTSQNIFDKLAAFHPLDSEEYRAIEDEIVRGFHDGLDNLEILLSGSAE